MNVELYWNPEHTKYAVLVSRGFGAGWSTWEGKELAYDKRVVEFFLKHKDDKNWMRSIDIFIESEAHEEASEFFKSIGYTNCPYMGGFSNIHLEWVPVGKIWRMKEYDGSESIVYQEDEDWVCFN